MEPASPTEFAPPPAGGRVYSQPRRPGLGDCAPSGRIRLDALARWLQDVAYADVEDAGVAEHAVWVVRRNRIRVERFPRFAEHFELRTFCSGLGRMWAERRTTIVPEGTDRPVLEAVALWVHLDSENWRPAPFSEAEITAYGNHAAGRRISARLHHPGPPDGATTSRWEFRATDCDIADHVNNAAYWEPFEEELLRTGTEPERIDVEVEFRSPAQPGAKLIRADGPRRWIVAEDGEVHASLFVAG